MSDRALLIAFLICVAAILIALVTLTLMAISVRRRLAALPRIRPERAEPCDLAAEYHRFRSRQDRFEDRYPRRVA